MRPLSYILIPSRFGQFAIVWQETRAGPRVRRVLMPRAGTLTVDTARESWGAIPGSVPAVGEVGSRMAAYFAGREIAFRLDLLALEQCSDFQRRVLLAEYDIPRGQVSTYGRIARHLGVPGAARGVGQALARNPFPIIIPCHRAIAADGTLGGYQGGLAMKRALLEMEGVEFGEYGRVRVERFYYEV
jgi:methylated-DNA-[protein]-cysteine S-methyltransferase